MCRLSSLSSPLHHQFVVDACETPQHRPLAPQSPWHCISRFESSQSPQLYTSGQTLLTWLTSLTSSSYLRSIMVGPMVLSSPQTGQFLLIDAIQRRLPSPESGTDTRRLFSPAPYALATRAPHSSSYNSSRLRKMQCKLCVLSPQRRVVYAYDHPPPCIASRPEHSLAPPGLCLLVASRRVDSTSIVVPGAWQRPSSWSTCPVLTNDVIRVLILGDGP